MNISIELSLLIGTLLLAFSIVFSKAGYRFGVPTLLMFLIAGMLFGTDGAGIEFDNAHTAQTIGMIALCIILFTGGMDTRTSDIRPVLAPGLMLSTVGVLLTTILTGTFAYWLSGWEHRSGIGFTLLTSLLLAATMSSTDSASVFNILRSRRIALRHHLGPMLELESGSNDPMAYLLTIILIQCLGPQGIEPSHIALSFVLQFAVGIAAGLILGKAAVWTINRLSLANAELYSILVLCFIFIIYSTATLLQGNGYLAVYLAGITIGNARTVHRHDTSRFLNGITWLMQVVMFVMLGLLVNPADMLRTALFAVPVSLFMMLVARPASVWISLLPFGRRISARSKALISWVGLRGAAPILFATYPVIAGIPGATEIFNIVFFVTLMSLIFQGMSLAAVARALRLTDSDSTPADHFGVEIPDDIGSTLEQVKVTPAMLAAGPTIRHLSLPPGRLVMLVRRAGRYIVPNGSTTLRPGDLLLLISSTTS
ncbi:MAG: potassium/proton antiporter [Muribaculaceae bacterium]|nr:potassium/proton antiporter [Muribaculaceae bacterium]